MEQSVKKVNVGFRHEHGLVLYMDALGISSVEQEQLPIYAAKLKSFEQTIEGEQAKQEDELRALDQHTKFMRSSFTFGDSIGLTWQVYKDDPSDRWYWGLARVIGKAFSHALRNKLYLRGALSMGPYTVSEGRLLGQSTAEAVHWSETVDWIGILLTPTASFYVDGLALGLNMEGKRLLNFLFPKPTVPFKRTAAAYPARTINWPFFWRMQALEEKDDFEEAKSATSEAVYFALQNVESLLRDPVKIFNTLRFFEWTQEDSLMDETLLKLGAQSTKG